MSVLDKFSNCDKCGVVVVRSDSRVISDGTILTRFCNICYSEDKKVMAKHRVTVTLVMHIVADSESGAETQAINLCHMIPATIVVAKIRRTKAIK